VEIGAGAENIRAGRLATISWAGHGAGKDIPSFYRN